MKNKTTHKDLMAYNKNHHIQWVLKNYNNKDFIIQLKARFMYYLCITALVCTVVSFISTVLIQSNSNEFEGLNYNIVSILLLIILLFSISLVLLIKGNQNIASLLLLSSAFVGVWIIMWIDKGNVLVRFDTVAYIICILSFSSIFVSNHKSIIVVYTILNLLVLSAFAVIAGKQLNLPLGTQLDYLIDTGISIIFTGIVAFNIYHINKQSLDKAMLDIEERKKAEENLMASEEGYRIMFDKNPQPMMIYDLETLDILEVNDSATNHYGYSKEEFTSLNLKDIRPKEDIPYLMEEIKKVTDGFSGKGYGRHLKKNGEMMDVQISAHSIIYKNRKARHVLINDITDRIKSEEELKQSRDQFQSLVDNIPGITYRCMNDKDWTMLYISSEIENFSGYPSTDFIKNKIRSYASIMDEEDNRKNTEIENYCIAADKPWDIEYRIYHKDGSIRWAYEKGRAIKDSNGNFKYLDGFILDITDKKNAEEYAERINQRYINALEALPIGCILTDNNGMVNYMNRQFIEMFGYNISEIKSANDWFKLAYPDPEYRKFVEKQWDLDSTNLLSDNSDRIPQIYDVTTKDGQIKTIEFIQNFYAGELLILFSDISFRKKAEDALIQSEKQFKNIIENAPNGIIVNDTEGRFLLVNKAFLKDVGFRETEILGKTSYETGIYKFEDIEIYRDFIDKKIIDYREGLMFDKSGNQIPTIFSSTMIHFEGQPAILSSIINISEKKKIEQELEKYRNHLESLVEERTEELKQNIEELETTQEALEKRNNELNQLQLELINEKKLIDSMMDAIPDAIYFKDLQSKFIKVSKSMIKRYARTGSMLGKTDFDYFADEHAIPAFKDEQQIIHTGIPVIDLVEKETWKDGSITYVSTTKMPLYDANGNITGTFGISRDITKMIALESAIKQQNEELNSQREELETALDNLQLTQKQLIQAEKMASLGTLAAGVAHEINNPLNFINGGILGIENYFNDNLPEHLKEVSPLIKGIQTGVNRAAAIVTSLSHYSRKDNVPPVACELNAIIDHCLIMIQNEIVNRIQIEKNLVRTNYELICNEGKLHQAMLNILINAVQAIEGKGKIFISSEIYGKNLKIIVKDTGTGIKNENLSKIFDPFFTTKEPGKGTGLGLSITYNIIQELNGTIEIESEEGIGTTVTITLPIKKSQL